MGWWVKHRADKRGKVAELSYKSFVTFLERADKKTGLVGKKLIVHLPISVTKWVGMASLNEDGFRRNCYTFQKSVLINSSSKYRACKQLKNFSTADVLGRVIKGHTHYSLLYLTLSMQII